MHDPHTKRTSGGHRTQKYNVSPYVFVLSSDNSAEVVMKIAKDLCILVVVVLVMCGVVELFAPVQLRFVPVGDPGYWLARVNGKLVWVNK